jgi:hypothetical protein
LRVLRILFVMRAQRPYGLDAIVTRNIEDFASVRLEVFARSDFIKKHQEIFENLDLD